MRTKSISLYIALPILIGSFILTGIRFEMEKKNESQDIRLGNDKINFQFAKAVHPDEKIEIPDNSLEFSFLSYNILAESYIKPDWYKSSKSEHLAFKYRSKIITEEIQILNPDIIILQEVDNLKSFYSKALQDLGYNLLTKPRKGKPDACLLAYKKDKFELLKDDYIDFDVGHDYQYGYYQTANHVVVASLKHIESSKVIHAIGTHFFWNPRTEDVKFLQAYLVMQYIGKNFKEDDLVIWGGDLNTKVGDNTLYFITENRKPTKERIDFWKQEVLDAEINIYAKAAKIENKFTWGNLLELYGPSFGLKDATYPPHTNYTDNFKAVLDHIFYNKKALYVKSLMKVPSAEEIGTSGTPNERYPSDHLPIMGIFGIRSNLK